MQGEGKDKCLYRGGGVERDWQLAMAFSPKGENSMIFIMNSKSQFVCLFFLFFYIDAIFTCCVVRHKFLN